MYVGMVQSLMIVTMFIEVLGLNISRWWYLPIFIVFIFGSLVVGYLDTRMGFRSEEMRNNSVQNPVFMEILETVQDIRNNGRGDLNSMMGEESGHETDHTDTGPLTAIN